MGSRNCEIRAGGSAHTNISISLCTAPPPQCQGNWPCKQNDAASPAECAAGASCVGRRADFLDEALLAVAPEQTPLVPRQARQHAQQMGWRAGGRGGACPNAHHGVDPAVNVLQPIRRRFNSWVQLRNPRLKPGAQRCTHTCLHLRLAIGANSMCGLHLCPDGLLSWFLATSNRRA